MDRPRRALIEEPDDGDDESTVVVARRSGGFAPVDDDDTAIRPIRSRRAWPSDAEPAPEREPVAPDPGAAPPRPRRALPPGPPSAVAAASPSSPVASAPASPTSPPRTGGPDARVAVAVPDELFRPVPAAGPDHPERPPVPVEDPPTFVPAGRVVGEPARDPAVAVGPVPDTRRVAPIVVDRLVKSFDGVLAVRNLSFTVQPGRVTGFLGPNGAGKTTTLRILVGLVAATTGSATFGGTAYADLDRPQRRVGVVLDAYAHPGRSGRNHLRILAATAGVSDARVDELLDLVGLSAVARRPTGRYSDGMRQRLALAAALLGDPDYLILDEPTNGLDPDGIRWLRRLLRDFAHAGRAVLVSSHVLHEVQATADDIVVINQGSLLTQMPLTELNLGGGVTRVRVADLDAARAALAQVDGTVETGHDDRGVYLRVSSPEVAAVGAALFGAGVVVYELVAEQRDLEQEFFALLEDSA